jgi:hypothetical protein
MARTKVLSLPKSRLAPSKEALVFGLLLALAIGLPFLIHFQPVTGTAVNAVLFIATVVLGSVDAAVIGFLPSVVAFSAGQLPAVLAPMIPFIIASNVLLVVVFGSLWKKSFFAAVAAAALAKFLFLQLALQILLRSVFAGSKAATVASVVVSWPQLATALAGGVAAYTFLKSVNKVK